MGNTKANLVIRYEDNGWVVFEDNWISEDDTLIDEHGEMHDILEYKTIVDELTDFLGFGDPFTIEKKRAAIRTKKIIEIGTKIYVYVK